MARLETRDSAVMLRPLRPFLVSRVVRRGTALCGAQPPGSAPFDCPPGDAREYAGRGLFETLRSAPGSKQNPDGWSFLRFEVSEFEANLEEVVQSEPCFLDDGPYLHELTSAEANRPRPRCAVRLIHPHQRSPGPTRAIVGGRAAGDIGATPMPASIEASAPPRKRPSPAVYRTTSTDPASFHGPICTSLTRPDL